MANQGNENLITTGPNLADFDIVDSLTELKSYTNYSTLLFKDATGNTVVSDVEVQAAISYRDAFKQGDITTAVNNFYNSLQNTPFKNISFSFDAIMYWFQKLIYSNKELLSLNNHGATFGSKIAPLLNPAVSNTLQTSFMRGLNAQGSNYAVGNNAFLGNTLGTAGPLATVADTGTVSKSFFGNVSDSIGTLANTKYMQTDATQPIFDVDQNYYGVPITYSASTDNKISNNVRNITYNLSQLSTAFMRRNLLNVTYSIPADPRNMATGADVAHSVNLQNDLPSFLQINNALPGMVSSLALKYVSTPRLFQFIQYLSNIGNYTAVNLRDIFPVTSSDKDFNVVASDARALQANQEIKDISNNAITQSYLEQQGINYTNQYSPFISGPTGINSSIVPLPNPTDLGPNADPATVAKNLGLTNAAAQNAIVAYNTSYSEAKKQGATDSQAQQVAAAICGNIAQESGFNPNTIHDNGIGYGLLGENQDQLVRMREYAISRGADPNNIDTKTQIQALFQEPSFYQRGGYNGMITATNVTAASYNFAVQYLKPTVATANYGARANNAIAINNGNTAANATTAANL